MKTLEKSIALTPSGNRLSNKEAFLLLELAKDKEIILTASFQSKMVDSLWSQKNALERKIDKANKELANLNATMQQLMV